MFVQRIGGLWLLTLLAASALGQTIPQFSKAPTSADTKLSGSAQSPTNPYDQVKLYICESGTRPSPPSDCSAPVVPPAQKVGEVVALVNLGTAPNGNLAYPVNSPDGKFTITLVSSLPQGIYVWIVQKTRVQADQTVTTRISDPVPVRVPLIIKASFGLTGTDSASRDAGGKVTLDLGHGSQSHGIGETVLLTGANYDDKWKAAPSSSNVTQSYSGQLYQSRQFATYAAWGPAATAYHNNTQGIRVEQTYGAGIAMDDYLGNGTSVQLGAFMEALLENLYSPGVSTNLGGIHLEGELDHKLGKQVSTDVTLAGTPVFTQAHAWSASGSFDLNVTITQHWSIDFNAQDNYYEIAPKTFNKNYLAPSINLTYK
jgi:hypothetical protein